MAETPLPPTYERLVDFFEACQRLDISFAAALSLAVIAFGRRDG